MSCESANPDHAQSTLFSGLFSASISLFGSAFMLTTFLFRGKGKGISKFITFIALGDYVASVGVIIPNVFALYFPDAFTYSWCVGLRFLWQLAMSSTVFWTTCTTWFIYRSLSVIRYRPRWLTWIGMALLCWGLPVLVCILLGALNAMDVAPLSGLCFPREPYHLILWFSPIIASYLATLLFYILIHKVMWQKKAPLSLSMQVTYRVSLYALIFLLCWALDIGAYLYYYFNPCHVFALDVILYNLINLQGAFDAIVFGATNKQLKKDAMESPLFTIIQFLFSPILVFPAFVFFCKRTLLVPKQDLPLQETLGEKVILLSEEDHQ
eukprot:TRINITY_DN9894_c0_g1_i1.p1 TRINITY_DN9894_c0_g1~~TRINITY_DN9894_c0_g1_i1.p1  ORF type:complete len:333 (-),score=37.02 TRINITY_DN9894_c0_g1_i1:213-1184(-)